MSAWAPGIGSCSPYCSAASVGLGFYFRPHYFITLLPVLALLCGVAVSRCLLLIRREAILEVFVALGLLFLAFVGAAASVVGNAADWFSSRPEAVTQGEYETTLFSDAKSAADYIRQNSSKDARIAVLGPEPEIYFYARRRSVTGYIYTYPLLEQQAYASRMQKEMQAQIERGAPEYVVYVDHRTSSWGRRDTQPEMFNWWMRYWKSNLNVVSTTGIRKGGAAAAREEAQPELPAEQPFDGEVLVLKRK
jgi:hypothetical protein